MSPNPKVPAARWLGGALLLLGFLLIWFYIPVKQFLFRLGVPSHLTPIPALGGLVLLFGAGIWLFRRKT